MTKFKSFSIRLRTPGSNFWPQWFLPLLGVMLMVISICSFVYFSEINLTLAYNDARSHLNIGRRVVEGLKPGLAQLGSVWLPLTHLLMAPTIWNDTMWHTGLAGAMQSMLAFIITGLLISTILNRLGVNRLGQLIAVLIFATNLNILYLQSTAMTELMLLVTMTAGCYYLIKWHQNDAVLDLVKSGFWIMLSTLIRYDGWFLLLVASALVAWNTFKKHNIRTAEGTVVLFCSLAGFGIALWFLWNLLIFKDPLYFAFGPFSAHTQQEQLLASGGLPTKGNLVLSSEVYLYALLYNSYSLPAIIALVGLICFISDRSLPSSSRMAGLSLLAPLVFNVVALYMGHSVLYLPDFSGNSWFNIRYGVMTIPAIAIFCGYAIKRLTQAKWLIIGTLMLVIGLAFFNHDAVTVDDARYGSSQKNVTEVAGFLNVHAKNQKEFILISAASHDAIIFSSGLPMKRFIHEGTGAYWDSATINPDRWARWIIMRTYDNSDLTWKNVNKTPGFSRYDLVGHYPFADIYELKPEFVPQLITTPIFANQK